MNGQRSSFKRNLAALRFSGTRGIILAAPLFLTLLFGLAAGYLVNYLADTLPVSRRLARPACRQCQQSYPWKEYLGFKPCPQCGNSRLPRVWLTLAGFSALSILLWFNPPARFGYWLGYALLMFFGLVAIIDLEHRIVMHPLSLLGGLIGLVVGWRLHGFGATVLGAVAGFGVMLILYYLGEVFARWVARSRQEKLQEVALGFGDVILSGVLGLFLGWPGIMLGLFFAILLGGLTSAVFILVMILSRRYQPFTAIPYAPFLILAALVLLYRT